MANIDTKYEVWKNKLLDLGKRNLVFLKRESVLLLSAFETILDSNTSFLMMCLPKMNMLFLVV